MLANAALVTVKEVEPVTVPMTALMDAAPALTAAANPEVSTVAAAALLDAQVTRDEMSCLVPSSYTPVAVNCSVSPMARVLLDGETEMDCSIAPGGGVPPPLEP